MLVYFFLTEAMDNESFNLCATLNLIFVGKCYTVFCSWITKTTNKKKALVTFVTKYAFVQVMICRKAFQ